MPETAKSLLRFRWQHALERNVDGAPLLSPLFVAEQGPGVHLVDIRDPSDATGVLGAVPGSNFVDAEHLESAVRASDRPVVLLSATGRSAATTALQLEQAGIPRVAAMAGGIGAWRLQGLGTTRGPVTRVTEITVPATLHTSGSKTLSLEEVRAHIGDPRSVHWIRMAALVAQGQCSCIDGRDERGVIGTPGGDAGEFLLSLGALEKVTGTVLDESQITATLQSHIDNFGAFYMHTDEGAHRALFTAIIEDERLPDPQRDLTFLRSMPPETHDILLEHLANPEYVGCGHLRLMAQHSDEYGVRRDLVTDFLRSFCRLWWAGAPELSLTLLPGGHNEGAVVNIHTKQEQWPLSPIPLVSPAYGGIQMFVNHPEVMNYLRGSVVEFHMRGGGPVAVPDADAFRATLDEIANLQLVATLGYLADGLPVYDVYFGTDSSAQVTIS